MNLYHKYIRVFNNEYLKYLYEYDKEILYVEDKMRACLLVYIDKGVYAIPFRSNMIHLAGRVFRTPLSKYGLDFTKAIPVYDQNLLKNEDFKLKRVEDEYYKEDTNYLMIVIKFKEYLEKIYYKDKYHTTDHKLLEYAQKYKIFYSYDKIEIFNHKQELVTNFTSILEYETLYSVLDEIYINIEKFKNKDFLKYILHELENKNKNIIVILKEVDE